MRSLWFIWLPVPFFSSSQSSQVFVKVKRCSNQQWLKKRSSSSEGKNAVLPKGYIVRRVPPTNHCKRLPVEEPSPPSLVNDLAQTCPVRRCYRRAARNISTSRRQKPASLTSASFWYDAALPLGRLAGTLHCACFALGATNVRPGRLNPDVRRPGVVGVRRGYGRTTTAMHDNCLLYTSDAADE